MPRTVQSGVKGAYIRRISVDIQDITRHRRLVNYFKQYYHRYLTGDRLSRETHLLLNSVPTLSYVPCLLLAYTLCRFNELSQLSIEILKSFENFEIKSSKSSHIRTIPHFEHFKDDFLIALDNDTQLLVISYDSLRNSIRSARVRNNIDLPEKSLDCTHIFRHLEASFMAKNGVPIDDISYKLGHISNKTTYQYIH